MDEWITQLYKSKGGFAKNTLENRRSAAMEKRRDNRNTMLSQLRQIPQIMSPLQSEKIEVPQEQPQKSKRLEMLEKWRKEKEKKKLEEKKKQKPIFKVCRVKSSENLNEVYDTIKGKKIIKEKAAASMDYNRGKKNSKATSTLQISKKETSYEVDKTLKAKNISRVDKITNTKSSTFTFNGIRANTGHSKNAAVSHKIPQSTSKGREVHKNKTSNFVDARGNLLKSKNFGGVLLSKKSAVKDNKVSFNKPSTSGAYNTPKNSPSTKSNFKEPKKTPFPKYHKDSSDKIKKIESISPSRKSENVDCDRQESINPFNSSSNQQTYTESQIVVEKSKSPSMSFAGSMLHITANHSGERTFCDSDYTLKVENINNSREGFENKSLRISLQKNNIEKKIASEENQIRNNNLHNFDENPTEKEEKMKQMTPNGLKAEYSTNCFINLTPLDSNRCFMESTPLQQSQKSSAKSPGSSRRTRSNFSKGLIILNRLPSEEALHEQETSATSSPVKSSAARPTRRSSRIHELMLKKNASTLEDEGTVVDESSSNLRSKSRKSRASIINTPKAAWNLKINDSYKEKTPKDSTRKSKTKKRKSVLVTRSLDEEYFTPNKSPSDQEASDHVYKTPQLSKDNDEVIAYISPFVTTSRGKTAARKEYHMRKSVEGGLDSSIAGATDPKSPKAAAAYFERTLNREVVRIQELCDVWQNYKENDNVSDDACGLIDMTIGQSNLLLTKKFKQFRELIERSRNNDQADMKVRCEDLHGFWDMIFKQVQDLDKRFENLEDMKKNNWLEEAPKKKTPKKRATRKKKGGRSKPEASSLLKEAIMAGRRKKAQSRSDPNVEAIITNSTPDHKILANRSMPDFERNSTTPARGILKSVTAKSEKRKNVVFVEAYRVGDKENIPSGAFVRNDTPLPTRKSNRMSLGRSKLVFD